MLIIKRSGVEDAFDASKIKKAIVNANNSVDGVDKITDEVIEEITNEVVSKCEKFEHSPNVEDIQDMVEDSLMKRDLFKLARNYITYRYKRAIIRRENTTDKTILSLIDCNNEEIKQENSNKNSSLNSTQRDYMAGEVSKDISKRLLIPEHIWEAHESGKIHFHDTDYFAQKMFNCCLVNTKDMLENCTMINGTLIETPHSFSTACNVATQIMAQVASNQYGGQSHSLAHLAPYVDVSRKKFRKEVIEELKHSWIMKIYSKISKKKFNKYVDEITEIRVKDEIKKGVQIIQYQINTLMTCNGQAPFVTIFMYLNELPDGRTKDDLALIIEEVVKQRYQGVKNEKGQWVTPAFPKLIYVLEEDNITEDSKYWYLTELCAKCSAKRLVPDYISEKKMLEYKVDANGEGHCFPCMGCRSFLSPYIDEDGNPKYYGRFNQGVVTINLPDVALSAKKEVESLDESSKTEATLYKIFWKIFDERLELCHEALKLRHERLEGTLSDVSPIHWQYGAIARLKKGETIDKLLHGGYSTISLGYAGLYECVLAMTGKSHTDPDAKPFALRIMEYMNEKCNEWKEAEDVGYSLYGTPIESTTYKFARCLKDRFGTIEGITDHNYITNSYHVNVRENIDPYSKLKFESEFQVLSPGGAISYVESSNQENNIESVLDVMKYIYDNILYAELNSKSDYCECCDYEGEIKIVTDDDGKLVWECPKCGNRDQNKMSVARRTCGYIGSQFWNQGRTQEIRDRVVHLGGNFEEGE